MMVHRVLIAVDGSQDSLRAVEYAGQVFALNQDARLVLFHVLPAISRMLLDEESIKTIDAHKGERPDLAGVYWRLEDEQEISQFFVKAKKILVEAGAGAGLF